MPNPVPRVKHPEWLHKRLLEKNDNFKQRRIDDMFSAFFQASQNHTQKNMNDIEDIGHKKSSDVKPCTSRITKRKRTHNDEFEEVDINKSWKEILGPVPPFGVTKVKLI